MSVQEWFLPDEAATLALGRAAADYIRAPAVVYLNGHLGAGKTTFTRGYLQGLGHQGSVKSPTYAIVESYALPYCTVHHFDLYRFADPEEWADAGLDDLFGAHNICLIEWPSLGAGYVPAADWRISLETDGSGRRCRIERLGGKEPL